MVNNSVQNTKYKYIKQVKSRNSAIYEQVLSAYIETEPYLRWEFMNFSDEKEHLEAQADTLSGGGYTVKTNYYLSEIFKQKTALSYTEFCRLYADKNSCSYEAGKKYLNRILSQNFIVKTPDGKYMKNGNELRF